MPSRCVEMSGRVMYESIRSDHMPERPRCRPLQAQQTKQWCLCKVFSQQALPGKSVEMAMEVLAADVWAQCDREECQKWRRLPPGTVIDEESKWCLSLECPLFAHPPPPPAPKRVAS